VPNIAGNLLLNRMHLFLAPGVNIIHTGLQQDLRAFPVGEPTDDPAPNHASRIMVFPLSPIVAWAGVTHGEPYMDPTSKTIRVAITNPTQGTVEVNVLFWDPHSIVCPLDAMTYGNNPA
jgi:hypothetical protein